MLDVLDFLTLFFFLTLATTGSCDLLTVMFAFHIDLTTNSKGTRLSGYHGYLKTFESTTTLQLKSSVGESYF